MDHFFFEIKKIFILINQQTKIIEIHKHIL